MSAYELGVKRLIQRVRQFAEPWNPTPIKREIDSFAKRLEALADDFGVNNDAPFCIECEHDRELGPGLDGRPIELPYIGIVYQIKRLADSARRASKSLPNSRKKHALPFAALGLLYLRQKHDFARPALSDMRASHPFSIDSRKWKPLFIRSRLWIMAPKPRRPISAGGLESWLSKFHPKPSNPFLTNGITSVNRCSQFAAQSSSYCEPMRRARAPNSTPGN